MISLDALIIFTFILPFLTFERLTKGGNLFLPFVIIFPLLFAYFLLDLQLKKNKRKNFFCQLKYILLVILIILTLGRATLTAIAFYREFYSIEFTHDSTIQQQAAVNFFLQGKNPYSTNYFGTDLEKWRPGIGIQINRALFHFNMPPFFLYLSTFFYLLSVPIFGFFDGRLMLLAALLGIAILTLFLQKNWDKRLIFLSFVALNPGYVHFFVEGRNDILPLFFLLLTVWLLKKKKFLFSSFVLALAFGVKQSTWVIFPFYVAYLYLAEAGRLRDKFLKTVKNLIPFILTIILIFLPFVIWDAKSLWEDLILYMSGVLPTSYEIAGFGFSQFVLARGWVKSAYDYYPFWIWQVLFGLPLMIWLLLRQAKNNTVSRLILNYGLFLFVFWFFSRYFHNSHVGYLAWIFAASWFLQD